MICVFAPDATDFSTNGLGAVDPHVCTVTETLNGEWELTLEHMIDDAGKWARLAEGNIIRAPVPAAMTPRTATIGAPGSSTEIWKITGGNVRLRAGAGTNFTRLKTYKLNDEMIVVNKSNASWYECIAPDGKRGFMATSYLAYVRTETVAAAVEQVVEPKQMRDQPFRIYRIVPEMDKVKVYARHIFYDLLDNMIQSYKPTSSTTGAQVLAGIAGNCLSAHDFTLASDLTETAEDVEFENVNPVEAILGAGGLVEKYGGELARDWYDVYVVERVGADAGVQVREGKNLLGISYDVDVTDVVTRIMPTGEDEDGKPLYLPELYIDSPNIGDSPKWVHLPVSEAKEVTTGDDKKTKEQCYTAMRDAVAAEYENGCDLPTVTLKVDFINCADTEEYKQYAALQNIYIGDGVRVLARRVGVAVTMRMTQYTYDCLTRKYTSMTLGTVADTLEGNVISARQLPNGLIRGAKLALGSVGAGQLINGSIGSLKIGMAAIDYAHIQQATINTLMANSIEALKAKINEIVAGTITTDALYAALADVITLRFGQAVGGSVQTDELRALYAELLHGEIGTANVGFQQVKDLIADTQIFTEGVGGQLFITRLNVTDANMVHLTVGELVVKGADGKFYAVTVAPDGTLSATEKPVVADNIADNTIPGGKLIENTITAREINVDSLFADAVLARKITTAMLAVGAVEAINIKSGAIETTHLAAATITSLGNTLNLTANETLRLAVGSTAAPQRLRNSDAALGLEYWGGSGVGLSNVDAAITREGVASFRISRSGAPAPTYARLQQALGAREWRPGDALTFSAYLARDQESGFDGDDPALRIYYIADGQTTQVATSIRVIDIPFRSADEHLNAWQRFEVTGVVPPNATEVGVYLQLAQNGTLYMAQPKLEVGEVATAWVRHPDEFRAGSSILIQENKMFANTEEFSVSVPLPGGGDETMMQIDGNGAQFESLSSPDVAPRYTGATAITIDPNGTPSDAVYTSLSEFLSEINDRVLGRDVTVTVASGASLNEDVIVRNISGGGSLTIIGNSSNRATINGRIRAYGVTSYLEMRYFVVNAQFASGSTSLVEATHHTAMMRIRNCVVNGNAYTLRCVVADLGSKIFAQEVEVYGGTTGICASYLSQVDAVSCKGSGFASYALQSLGGTLLCGGTIPAGATNRQTNGILDHTGCTQDSGSGTAPPVLTTKAYSATLTGWHQLGWSSETQMRQGYTTAGGAPITGGMWFNNTTIRSDLSGKTIKSATLRLYRKPSGRSSAIEVFLYGTIDANKGGSQVRTKNYGILGTIARSTGKAFAIPTAAITDLRAGTINGLFLYTGETTARSEGYSNNYGTFGGTGDGADRIPQLTVTYE